MQSDILKGAISGQLHDALFYINKQHDVIVMEGLKRSIAARNEVLVKSQLSVVKLQEEVIASKDEQLQSLLGSSALSRVDRGTGLSSEILALTEGGNVDGE